MLAQIVQYIYIYHNILYVEQTIENTEYTVLLFAQQSERIFIDLLKHNRLKKQ